MKVCDYTKQELDYYRRECNFTPTEEELFELRARDVTLEQSAEIMNLSVSTVKRLSVKIKEKIDRA